MIGPSLGIPGYRGQMIAELFTVGVNFTHLHANRLGGDFAFGLAPRVMAEGAIALVIRSGLALPITLGSHFLLVPSGGVSLAGLAGGFGVGAWGGANGGLAAIMAPEGSHAGLRLGMTWHSFWGMLGPMWLFEVGIVRVPPRKSHASGEPAASHRSFAR